MKQCVWLRLFFGTLLVVMVACRPISEEQGILQTTKDVTTTQSPAIAQQATAPSNVPEVPTNLPPPEPTPLPTVGAVENWLQIGNEAAGIKMSVPPDWINLSDQLDTHFAANQLGLVSLLAANTNRTGTALLANKGIGNGAYAAGLITSLDSSTSGPATALTTLLDSFAITPISTVMNITAASPSLNFVSGAYTEYEGTPLIFSGNNEQTLRTRIYLFSMATNNQPTLPPTQAIFLFSADPAEWNQHLSTFEQIASSIVIYDIFGNLQINDGTTNVLGNLGETDIVHGRLQSGGSDIWTFNGENGRYATITASPDDKDIDLRIAIIGPSGQTITELDNGFAGDSEVLIDFLLLDTGTYLIEIDEFFNETGRYTLSLVLTDDPLFVEEGQITIGQTIQSDLPPNVQKVWRFNGTAGEQISIVLIPETPFDAILNLHGPDGTRLVGLDEGFNGDPELLSGYELPLTGDYTILVNSFAGDGGSYSLSLDTGGENTLNFHDAGDIVYDETKQETLQANEAHAWFFNGKQGDEIGITVTPLDGSMDMDIWLLDPDIERLDAQDNFLAGEAEQITHVLPRDGQYLILVSEFFGVAGNYEIYLSANAAETPTLAGTLEYGDIVDGTLASNQSVIWTFPAKAGDLIDISLSTTETSRDLNFYIQGPDGVRVKSVDATGTGEAESLPMFTIPTDGEWGIVIKEFYGDVTPYSLRIEYSN
ncbi:MAG: hypothetical protein GY943_37855 [Chloroflexi bacterium]|nr:hypothetical protein [Chloroflexota bacterium]